jgi:hypothetical protein
LSHLFGFSKNIQRAGRNAGARSERAYFIELKLVIISFSIYVEWEIILRHVYDEDGAKALAGNFLKALIRKKGVKYQALALKLRRWGWHDSAASLANRLSRGAFSAGFFITVLKAVGEDTLSLTEIERLGLRTEKNTMDLRRARLVKK